MTTRRLLYAALALLALLHQDAWNWDTLSWTLGLPAGLFHHIAFCLAVSTVMAALLRLDRTSDPDRDQ
jgi:hypothetical protein